MYLDVVAGRKMGLSTQILPSLFRVILLSYAHLRHIKRPKVQSCSRSSFVERKALPTQGLRPNGQERCHNRQRPTTGCVIICNRAESDSTLARMTHMLTASIVLCEQGRARIKSQRCREDSWPGYASQNKGSPTTPIKARSSLSVSAAIYTCHSFGQELGPGTLNLQKRSNETGPLRRQRPAHLHR
jgi:hypothetical protein